MKKLLLVFICIMLVTGCSIPTTDNNFENDSFSTLLPTDSNTLAPAETSVVKTPTPVQEESKSTGSQLTKPEINSEEIKSVTFTIGSHEFSQLFSINNSDYILWYTPLSYGDAMEPKKLSTWEEQKWNAFLKNMLSCEVAKWKNKYNNPNSPADGESWSLTLTGDFGSVDRNGYCEYPKEWDAFMAVMNKYGINR